MSELFEVGMVVLFGISWPMSILKSVRSKTAKGKSIMFMGLIWLGYISGIACKLTGGNVTYVLFFYVLNLIMVSIDIGLYFINKKRDTTLEAKHA